MSGTQGEQESAWCTDWTVISKIDWNSEWWHGSRSHFGGGGDGGDGGDGDDDDAYDEGLN